VKPPQLFGDQELKPKSDDVHLVAGEKPFIYKGWVGWRSRKLETSPTAKWRWPRRHTHLRVMCGCGVKDATTDQRKRFERRLDLITCPACKVAWDKAHSAGAQLGAGLVATIPVETFGAR
jgi:hypothetical protein